MDWLILTSYFLWFFSPLSNPVVHIWLRLRGPQYSIHIAVPDVFEPPDIERIDPSDFVERPVHMYSNPYGDELEHAGDGGKVDSHTTQAQQAERQGSKKSPLFKIQLTKSFSIVAYDNPRTIYLHYERIYEGVNRVTWINLNLASQLLWLVYMLCLAAGVVEMLAYTLCAGSVRYLHWLVGTIIGLCSSQQIEGSVRQLLPQAAHLEALAMFRALQEIYDETPVVAGTENAQSLESDVVSKIQQKDSARSSESDTNGAGDAPQQYDERPDSDRANRPADMSYETLVEMMEFEFQLKNLFDDAKPFGPASERHAPIADPNAQEVKAPAKSAEIEAFPEIQDGDLKLEIQLESTEAPPKADPKEHDEILPVKSADIWIEGAEQGNDIWVSRVVLKQDDVPVGSKEPSGIQDFEIQTEPKDLISVSDSSELSINMQESEELSMIEASENVASAVNPDILEPEPELSESSEEDVPFEPVESFHIEEIERLAKLFTTIPDSAGKPCQLVESEQVVGEQVAMTVGSAKPSNNQEAEVQAQLENISATELSESEELSMVKEPDSKDLISVVDCSETSAQNQDTFDYTFTESLADILYTQETFFMDQNDELLQPTLQSDAAEKPIDQVNRTDDIQDSTPASPDVVPFKSQETFSKEVNDDMALQEQFANLLKISNEDSFKAHKTAQEDDNWVSAVRRYNDPFGYRAPLKIQELEPAQARTDDIAELFKIEDIDETNRNAENQLEYSADALNGVPTKSEETVNTPENDERIILLHAVKKHELFENVKESSELSMVQGIAKEAVSDELISSVDCCETSSDTHENNSKLETRLANKILVSEGPQPDDTIGNESQRAEVPAQTRQISEGIRTVPETCAESEHSMTTSEWSELNMDMEEIIPAPSLCFPNASALKLSSGFYEQVGSSSIAGADSIGPGVSPNMPDVEFSSATEFSLTEADFEFEPAAQQLPQPHLSIPDATRPPFPRGQQPAVPIWPGCSEIAVVKLCLGTGPAVPIWANVPELELSSASSMSLTESLPPASSISDVEFRSVTQLAVSGPNLPVEPYNYTPMSVVDSGQQQSADLSGNIPDVELSVPAPAQPEVSLVSCERSVGSVAKSRSASQLNETIVPKWSGQSSGYAGTRSATQLSGRGVAQLDLPIASCQSSFKPVGRTSSATQLASTRGSPESLNYAEDEFHSFPNLPIGSNESLCISGDEFHSPIVLSFLGIPQPDVGSHTSDAEFASDNRLLFPGVPEPVAPMWPDESLNVDEYDFDVENIGAYDDDLQEYIRSYEPAGSPVAAVSPTLEPMSTESEQDVMETDDLENPDGTVQVTLFLPDGQPYVLDYRRLDHI